MQKDIDSVLEFAKRNKVPVRRGFVCVDGRYDQKYSGFLARPGGNFRGILVLLALRKKLGLTVGRLVDKVVDAVEEMGITFNMHSDDHYHDSHDLSEIGCGHIAKAEDPKHAKEYKVDSDDVHNALTYLRIKLEGRKYYQLIELHGEHREKGVLIITGTKYTVNHWDQDKNEMYFVFDKARDEEYQKELFHQFKKKFAKLTFEDFIEISDLQLNATLKNLAKDLPIYEVNLDQEKPQVKFIGKV